MIRPELGCHSPLSHSWKNDLIFFLSPLSPSSTKLSPTSLLLAFQLAQRMDLGYHHSLWPGPLAFSVSPYHLQQYIPESCGELLEDMDPVWVDLQWSLRVLIFNRCPEWLQRWARFGKRCSMSYCSYSVPSSTLYHSLAQPLLTPHSATWGPLRPPGLSQALLPMPLSLLINCCSLVKD